MKRLIEKTSTLLTVVVVAIFALTFTACSDDDEPVTEVTYTYGFSSMSASHPDFLEEMSKIEKTPLSQLSASPANRSPRRDRSKNATSRFTRLARKHSICSKARHGKVITHFKLRM